jgi:PhnB protein
MSAIPHRYHHAVIPHIMIDGAAEAIDFYKVAFGAEELMRIAHPDGRILHAEIRVHDSTLMLGDAEGEFRSPRTAGGTTAGLHVYVEDVDGLYHRAVAAGAESLQPPADMFYGDRTAMLRDPFGHVWVLLTHLEDLPVDEIVRRGDALLHGKGPNQAQAAWT